MKKKGWFFFKKMEWQHSLLKSITWGCKIKNGNAQLCGFHKFKQPLSFSVKFGSCESQHSVFIVCKKNISELFWNYWIIISECFLTLLYCICKQLVKYMIMESHWWLYHLADTRKGWDTKLSFIFQYFCHNGIPNLWTSVWNQLKYWSVPTRIFSGHLGSDGSCNLPYLERTRLQQLT